MSDDKDIVRAIRAYLAANFKAASIDQWEHEKQESINFKITDKDREYVLRVMNETLEGLQAGEVQTMLERYNTAQVMRDLGDFPIVVTNSGCIFGSP